MKKFQILYLNKNIPIDNFIGGGESIDLEPMMKGIKIGKSKFGNGVFATQDFAKNEIVEIAPALPIPPKDIQNNILKDYVFTYDTSNYGIVFGYGSIYNHNDNPSLNYSYTNNHKNMIYKTTRPIKSGEELFVSYGSHWWKNRNLMPE